jgi:hypothetical protein
MTSQAQSSSLTRKQVLVPSLLLASLFLGFQAFSWKVPDNRANQLLINYSMPNLKTVKGYLKPVNVQGATLGNVFGAIRVVPLEGAEFTIRCATPAPRSTCFARLPEGTIALNRVYQIGYADFGDYEKTRVKGAQVLLRLVDEGGTELLTPTGVMGFVKSATTTIPAALSIASAMFLIAGLVVLLSRKGGR